MILLLSRSWKMKLWEHWFRGTIRVRKHLSLTASQFRKSSFLLQPLYPMRVRTPYQDLELLMWDGGWTIKHSRTCCVQDTVLNGLHTFYSHSNPPRPALLSAYFTDKKTEAERKYPRSHSSHRWGWGLKQETVSPSHALKHSAALPLYVCHPHFPNEAWQIWVYLRENMKMKLCWKPGVNVTKPKRTWKQNSISNLM